MVHGVDSCMITVFCSKITLEWKRLHSRTSRSGNSSVLLTDWHPQRPITSYCDVMTSTLHIWHHHISFEIDQIRNSWKSHFLASWPWPLTYDLDHRTWPRFYLGQCPYQFLSPYLKWFSCESAELQTHTHRHTDGTDSITSTAFRGR